MPIINPIWFLLSRVFENISFISALISFGLAVAIIVMGIAYAVATTDDYDNSEDIRKACRSNIKKCICFLISTLIIYIICPNEATMTKMIVASVITKENIEYTKEEIIDIVEEINDIINNQSE